ncbi:MAG TPA: AAA family ATPase, partial [Acidimicrobiia bacterium]
MAAGDLGVLEVPLVERERELVACAELAATVAGGRGGVMVVEGVPGIGKTRVLQAAEAQAEAVGIRVLAARCSELERDFAFGAVRQLLDPVLRGVEGEQRAKLLGGSAELAAGILVGGGATPLEASPTDAAFAAMHAL